MCIQLNFIISHIYLYNARHSAGAHERVSSSSAFFQHLQRAIDDALPTAERTRTSKARGYRGVALRGSYAAAVMEAVNEASSV